MKKMIVLGLLLFFIGSLPVKAQFTESSERQEMWRRSLRRHKPREAFNPYLHKRERKKPSAIIARKEKQGFRKMRRQFKRQEKANMKKLGIKPVKVKKAK